MKKLFVGLLASSVLLAAGQALPCGAPFGAGVNVDPKQDILLAHKGDQETYVFQPTFCGNVKDFGVILPVPSLLTGAPTLADPNMLGVADTISAPEVIEKTECRSRGGLDAGAGSFGDASDGTTVVASGKVGFLDWVQLEAKDEASFTSWLDANGYPYDAKARATFAHYVTKKWFFVAFKVSNGAAPPGGKNCKSLGPIRLQFTSTTPVVPSRMATAGATTGGDRFSWRIFAITAAKEQLAFASGSSASQTIGFAGTIPSSLVARFEGIAGEGDRLTKMTLWFDGVVTADVGLVLAPPIDTRETVHRVRYVDCPASADAGFSPPGSDAGPDGGDLALTEATGGSGCATGGPKGASAVAVGLVLGGVALRRRRRI